MGVNAWLARLAVRRPHVLVVAVPGAWRARLALESAVEACRGVLAGSPAEADILAVCGQPGPQLGEVVQALWQQLPGPRSRLHVDSPDVAAVRLAEAVERLADVDRQRDDAAARQAFGPSEEPTMAERGPDRDGLGLDVLHLSLGPVLPGWPAGLVIDVELQGDVVQSASGRYLDDAGPFDGTRPLPGDARWRATLALDRVSRLLVVIGWDGVARSARRLRDVALAEPTEAALSTRRAELARRIERSRLLRRELAGVAVDDGSDARDRLLGWCRPGHDDQAPGEQVLATATRAMTGLELATARAALASFPLEFPSDFASDSIAAPVLAPEGAPA